MTDPVFVLLGIPDVNGSIRGKALRPDAFEAATAQGTVMTDLILGLDPVDTPITDYDRYFAALDRAFTGAMDLPSPVISISQAAPGPSSTPRLSPWSRPV